MRRLLVVCVLAGAGVLAPAAIASPTIRMAIVHVVHGCHVWGTADSQPLGPKRTLVVARGTRVSIRINCPMPFEFAQLAGPKVALGDPRTSPGTARTIVFARAGLYRFQATNTVSSADAGLETLGPDNTLLLTVRVR